MKEWLKIWVSQYSGKDEEMENPEFSKRLIQAREAEGLSQAEMARQLDMSQQSYCYYEHGREMKASMIVKTCAILNCAPAWLAGAVDDGAHLPPESPLLRRLKYAFAQLNNKGQVKVVEYTEDLAGNFEYRAEVKKKGACDPLPAAKKEIA